MVWDKIITRKKRSYDSLDLSAPNSPSEVFLLYNELGEGMGSTGVSTHLLSEFLLRRTFLTRR